jgi:hypothetical protein
MFFIQAVLRFADKTLNSVAPTGIPPTQATSSWRRPSWSIDLIPQKASCQPFNRVFETDEPLTALALELSTVPAAAHVTLGVVSVFGHPVDASHQRRGRQD